MPLPNYLLNSIVSNINYGCLNMCNIINDIYKNDKESFYKLMNLMNDEKIGCLLKHILIDINEYKWIYEFSWKGIPKSFSWMCDLFKITINKCEEPNYKLVDKIIEGEIIGIEQFVYYINYFANDINFNETFLYLYKQLGMPDVENKTLLDYRDKIWNTKKGPIQN